MKLATIEVVVEVAGEAYCPYCDEQQTVYTYNYKDVKQGGYFCLECSEELLDFIKEAQ